jgi:hypothetical protein
VRIVAALVAFVALFGSWLFLSLPDVSDPGIAPVLMCCGAMIIILIVASFRHATAKAALPWLVLMTIGLPFVI